MKVKQTRTGCVLKEREREGYERTRMLSFHNLRAMIKKALSPMREEWE